MIPGMLAKAAMFMRHKFQMTDDSLPLLRGCQKNEIRLMNIALFSRMFCMEFIQTMPLL
tara:strand:- start:999 stop:1175 length:177 start_codon:yes stop_codon:yes gene_type:complete